MQSDHVPDLITLKKQMEDISQKLELQGEIQLELARILQLFNAKFDSLSQASNDIVTSIAEATEKQNHFVGQNFAAWVNARFTTLNERLDSLQQVSNMALRRVQPIARRIRCAFIIQSMDMWDALAPVYEAMVMDERFDPVVMSTSIKALGRGELKGEKDVHEALAERHIPHIRLDVEPSATLDILLNLSPDVVFRQQQWDSPLPVGLQTRSISFSRICVVPYGMGVLAKADAKDASDEIHALNYDQTYHRAAWKVFCETAITQASYRFFAHSDPEKFILSGYPKHDKLLESKGKGVWPIAEPAGRTFRVIWAPHYSMGSAGIGFGVFDRIFTEMLEWVRTQADIQFVLKPHPGLEHVATESVGFCEVYRAFQEQWSSLPNCTIINGPYGSLFDASDLMLTDGVSFLTEYHLFEKPLIFFDSGRHHPFNELGRLAERASHRVSNFGEMKKAILAYKNGQSWKFEQERQDLLKVLRPFDKPAADIILDSIAEDLQFSRVSYA
ncbi:hypothetical protein H4S14_003694 [Agrobacterium vitis]|nr:hypothetical protein [Agrobacterium vitis]MBE1439926.1 hypothetical protein [Agrobacterium vitis]